MFIQNHSWNYSLDFKTSFGISKVLREKKKKKAKKKKLKGGEGFHISPVQTSEIILKPLPIAYAISHPTKHTCIFAYRYYFRDPPYLESPSHKAGSQRTSCERNKAIYLIYISAFPKESSLKLSGAFSKNPIKAMKGN